MCASGWPLILQTGYFEIGVADVTYSYGASPTVRSGLSPLGRRAPRFLALLTLLAFPHCMT